MFFILTFLSRPAQIGAAQGPGASAAAPRPDADSGALGSADLAMQRYSDGDDSAFPVLFAELGPRIRLFLQRMGCTSDVAEDLVQETFLRVHHARGSFARGKHGGRRAGRTRRCERGAAARSGADRGGLRHFAGGEQAVAVRVPAGGDARAARGAARARRLGSVRHKPTARTASRTPETLAASWL